MSAVILKTANMTSNGTSEYAVDTESEVALLPTTIDGATGDFKEIFKGMPLPLMGSTCLVGNQGGELIVYMLFGFGWKKL